LPFLNLRYKPVSAKDLEPEYNKNSHVNLTKCAQVGVEIIKGNIKF